MSEFEYAEDTPELRETDEWVVPNLEALTREAEIARLRFNALSLRRDGGEAA